MPNTSTRAAELGWRLYRSSEVVPALDDINRALVAENLPPVFPRMYKHYRSLSRHGYDRYVPINELDVAVKAQRLRAAS